MPPAGSPCAPQSGGDDSTRTSLLWRNPNNPFVFFSKPKFPFMSDPGKDYCWLCSDFPVSDCGVKASRRWFENKICIMDESESDDSDDALDPVLHDVCFIANLMMRGDADALREFLACTWKRRRPNVDAPTVLRRTVLQILLHINFPTEQRIAVMRVLVGAGANVNVAVGRMDSAMYQLGKIDSAIFLAARFHLHAELDLLLAICSQETKIDVYSRHDRYISSYQETYSNAPIHALVHVVINCQYKSKLRPGSSLAYAPAFSRTEDDVIKTLTVIWSHLHKPTQRSTETSDEFDEQWDVVTTFFQEKLGVSQLTLAAMAHPALGRRTLLWLQSTMTVIPLQATTAFAPWNPRYEHVSNPMRSILLHLNRLALYPDLRGERSPSVMPWSKYRDDAKIDGLGGGDVQREGVKVLFRKCELSTYPHMFVFTRGGLLRGMPREVLYEEDNRDSGDGWYEVNRIMQQRMDEKLNLLCATKELCHLFRADGALDPENPYPVPHDAEYCLPTNFYGSSGVLGAAIDAGNVWFLRALRKRQDRSLLSVRAWMHCISDVNIGTSFQSANFEERVAGEAARRTRTKQAQGAPYLPFRTKNANSAFVLPDDFSQVNLLFTVDTGFMAHALDELLGKELVASIFRLHVDNAGGPNLVICRLLNVQSQHTFPCKVDTDITQPCKKTPPKGGCISFCDNASEVLQWLIQRAGRAYVENMQTQHWKTSTANLIEVCKVSHYSHQHKLHRVLLASCFLRCGINVSPLVSGAEAPPLFEDNATSYVLYNKHELQAQSYVGQRVSTFCEGVLDTGYSGRNLAEILLLSHSCLYGCMCCGSLGSDKVVATESMMRRVRETVEDWKNRGLGNFVDEGEFLTSMEEHLTVVRSGTASPASTDAGSPTGSGNAPRTGFTKLPDNIPLTMVSSEMNSGGLGSEPHIRLNELQYYMFVNKAVLEQCNFAVVHFFRTLFRVTQGQWCMAALQRLERFALYGCPAADCSGSGCHLFQVIHNDGWAFHRERWWALRMASHERLGRHSAIKILDDNCFEMVFRFMDK